MSSRQSVTSEEAAERIIDFAPGWGGGASIRPGGAAVTALPHALACPACGQAILPARLSLPPIKARILHAVQTRPGITAEELRCVVWAHDPNGGPENFKAIHVHIHQLNQLIAPLGFVVRARRGCGHEGYRIRRLS